MHTAGKPAAAVEIGERETTCKKYFGAIQSIAKRGNGQHATPCKSQSRLNSRVIHEEEKPEEAEKHAVGRRPHDRHAEAQMAQPVDAHDRVRPGTVHEGARHESAERKLHQRPSN